MHSGDLSSLQTPRSRTTIRFIPCSNCVRFIPLTVALLGCATFGLLSFHQWRLPGLYYDEAADVVPAMQILTGQDVQLSRGVGIHLFGIDFPVMIGDYWGVVSTYAVLPLFALLGVGVFPIRLWTISAGMIAVLLTFALGRKLYTPPVGSVAAVLLAVFPSFLFWSRTGIYVISYVVALTLAIMLSFLRWRETGRDRWIFLACLLTGIGVSAKLLFLWFLIAVPVGYAALLVSDQIVERRKTSPKGWAADVWKRFRQDAPIASTWTLLSAFAGFLAGAFPVIHYNVVSQGSYLVFRANLFQTERGVENFALWENFKTQADGLKVLLDGGYFWYYGGIYTNPLYPWLVALSTLGLIVLVHRVPEFRAYRRASVFLVGFSVMIFMLSLFSVSILAATHLLILLPVPQLFVAASTVLGTQYLQRRIHLPGRANGWILPILLAIVLVPLIARDLWVDTQYHRALAQTGGHSSFSSAIYTLSDHLDTQQVETPYALDWGIRYPVMILTGGRVTPIEIFGVIHEPSEGFDTAVKTALETDGPVFISHTEEASAYPRLARFREIVSERQRELILMRTINQLDGKPLYYVFTVE